MSVINIKPQIVTFMHGRLDNTDNAPRLLGARDKKIFSKIFFRKNIFSKKNFPFQITVFLQKNNFFSFFFFQKRIFLLYNSFFPKKKKKKKRFSNKKVLLQLKC